MANAEVVQKLERVRDGASFKERIAVFATLPQEVMQAVVDQPGTISAGAGAVLAAFQRG